jgi:uncharacterized protein DUF4329
VQSDPIGVRGGLNTYAYVGSSPLRFRDRSGLVPGDLFDTESAAALDAHNYISRIPRSRHVEFSVVIYQLQSCKYSYTEVHTQGFPRTVTPDASDVPPDTDITADYHNHIPRTPGTRRYVPGMGTITLGDPNEFSPDDVKAYDQYGITGYMGVPGGNVYVYYPKERRRKEKCECPDKF